MHSVCALSMWCRCGVFVVVGSLWWQICVECCVESGCCVVSVVCMSCVWFMCGVCMVYVLCVVSVG